MKPSRRARRRILYAALLVSVAATVWWTLPQPTPEPAASTSVQSIEPLTAPVDEAAKAAVGSTADDAAAKPASAAEVSPQPESKPDEPVPKVRVYTVTEGDTVEAIATQFGLEPTSILWSNGIDAESLLQVGQQLEIPATDGIIHAVTEGDSFWDIADTYGVDVEEIVRANADISPDTLKPGDPLLIPDGKPPRRVNMLASRSGLETERRVDPPEPQPRSEAAGLVWPLSGELTESFGWRTHPVYGTRNYHEGIDIAVPPGTPIRAVASGRVVLAEWYGGYGLTIKVDHGDGLVSRYSHDSRLVVDVGETVEAGEVIAYSGDTGVSTGPHLDFGLYQGGQPIDPLSSLP